MIVFNVLSHLLVGHVQLHKSDAFLQGIILKSHEIIPNLCYCK